MMCASADHGRCGYWYFDGLVHPGAEQSSEVGVITAEHRENLPLAESCTVQKSSIRAAAQASLTQSRETNLEICDQFTVWASNDDISAKVDRRGC